MTVSIRRLDGRPGLEIEDTLDRRRLELHTSARVDPSPVEQSPFGSPVDTVASIRTSQLTLPEVVTTYVRDERDAVVANVEQFSHHRLPDGVYRIELSAPVKLYVEVAGPLEIDADGIHLTVSTDAEREFVVGARSYHERPAATITTTDDPRDVMEAMSYLGSAHKTTTADRSYPTLRGHPPEVVLGEELCVPDDLERPDTGVTVEVPATLGAAFVASPLAYYLGADLQVGDAPRLVTDDGFTQPLDGPAGFETGVERALKQAFFFDCLTREESPDMPLYERTIVERRTGVEMSALHGLPCSDRIAAYFSVPFDDVADCIPRWKLTAHVAPRPDSIEIVPFLVNGLAAIHIPCDSDGATGSRAQVEAVEEFMRGGFVDGVARCPDGGRSEPAAVPSFVEPEQTDSLEQAWVGDDVPVGASKALVEAFRNRLAREERDGDTDIVVVCNDPEMVEEGDFASSVYDSREELPFDVQVYSDLSKDRLRFVLESDIDFLHYVGHIDAEGFQCADGRLDVRTLDEVGVDAFFLNACRSYDQGIELIERGSIGGVVTLDNVIDSGAVRVGRAMARLLNRGFPLRAALDIASERSIVGSQYIVVGDGNFDIAHAESLIPDIVDVRTGGDTLRVNVETYPSGNIGMGTVYYPWLRDRSERYLIGSKLVEFDVTPAQLSDWLDIEVTPLRLDGELTWSDQVDFDSL